MTFEVVYDIELNLITAKTYGEYEFEAIKIMSSQIIKHLMSSEFKSKVIVDHTSTPLNDVNDYVLGQIINLTKELENHKTLQLAIIVNKLKDLFFVSLWKSNVQLYLNTQIDVFFTLEDAYEWLEI